MGVDGEGRVVSPTLSDSQLAGRIPPGLGQLASLEGLGLENNQLTGGLPAGLASVEILCLSGNQLIGEIPLGSVQCYRSKFATESR